MTRLETHPPETIEEAWLNLAADVLLLAIDDVRQNRDREKRKKAKAWLRSPAGQLFFESVIDPQFDVRGWVKKNCPNLGLKRKMRNGKSNC